MNVRAANNRQGGKMKRYVIRAVIVLIVVIALAYAAIFIIRHQGNPVPPINPTPPANAALNYPYKLVPGDRTLDMPTAEGRLANMDSDTWFLEGVLEGKETGHKYSFIVIYYVSWVYGVYPLNFYSFTLYDWQTKEYGTFTKYGNVKAKTGYLDLRSSFSDQAAVWTTAIDKDGYLVPFTYKVNFPGTDQNGNKMSLVADAVAKKPPVAVGADIFNGKITVFKQDNTFSYFQTGIEFDGNLNWGDRKEAVAGKLGHIDRQMFPQFSGINNDRTGRGLSHEWRTFFFDNGMDFSTWRQFDRKDHNYECCYGGATTYDSVNGARYFADLTYTTKSYVRTENHPVQPLVKPIAKVLYFPSRHHISSPALGLELDAEPFIKTPLIAFPIEYMHGPAQLSGTLAGKPITGIGSLEVTLAYYRDFELIKVLSDSVRYLPADAVTPNGAAIVDIVNTASEVSGLINSHESAAAKSLATGKLRTEVSTLAEPYKGQMLQVLDDLMAVMK